ncbi:MAG: YceI family protein [Candidatus Magasanikbacteria bacterium]|jgi:polyisoprenoid-binding protein YceI|nr:YceI family protein [Candidatus Magasanikbacteria bacterium]
MKARQTLLSLSLPFLAAALLLSGCGNKTADTPEPTPAADAEQAMEAAPEDQAPLTFTHAIVLNESSLTWAGEKIVGGAHNGTVEFLSGGLYLEDGNIVGGEFEVDMNTITDLDLTKEGSKLSLENHLKGTDFFDVENFPTAKVVITSAEPTGEAPPAATHNIVADLTIKGVTNEITFPANITFDDEQGVIEYSAEADMVLDRTKWNLTYGSGSFFKELGDGAIRDEMKLGFDLLVRQGAWPDAKAGEEANADAEEDAEMKG